ncbi:hypothetical protein IT570_03540 [Candidatus Sumerlaeota bacterium]|nr:hypothetical protein [Candidatus Sumerlaeota bacterium]
MSKRISFLGVIACAVALAGCAAFPNDMAIAQSKQSALEAAELRHLKEDIAAKGVPSEADITNEDRRLESEFWDAYEDDWNNVQANKLSKRDFFFKSKDSYENTWQSEVEALRTRRNSVLGALDLSAKSRDVEQTAWEEAQKKAASAKLDFSDLSAQ